MTWTSADTLIIAGNITLDGAPTALAAYNVPAEQWTPFNSRAPLEGAVTATTPASTHTYGSTWSSDRQGFWIAGRNADSSAFLKKSGMGPDGSTWPKDIARTRFSTVCRCSAEARTAQRTITLIKMNTFCYSAISDCPLGEHPQPSSMETFFSHGSSPGPLLDNRESSYQCSWRAHRRFSKAMLLL